MFVKEVILKNYRIYHGENQITFSPSPNKSVFIVSGNNGFGKTTFLTSLVWCLYGKLIVDVDDKYKREIYEAGGYKKYASNNLNRKAKHELFDCYSVEVALSQIHIPSLPCNEVRIKRSFSLTGKEDHVEILIDGQANELTKEVGPELFIQDFILPKEIAKFFFFDAEKIVELAEVKSVEDKRKLSKAYSEVLGIKKYEDLRNHLKDLRIRFRRNSASNSDKAKLELLRKEITEIKGLIQFSEEQIENLSEEKAVKRKQSDQYQEKLIREGNSLTLEELKNLKLLRDNLSEDGKELKSRIKEYLELAPFAISGSKLIELRIQLIGELKSSQSMLAPELLKEKIRIISKDFAVGAEAMGLDKKSLAKLTVELEKSLVQNFSKNDSKEFKVLLEFSETEKNELEALINNLKYSYSKSFKRLTQEEKNNRISLAKVVRKISEAESKENDLLIQGIREKKTEIDQSLQAIENKVLNLSQDIGALQNQLASKSKVEAELSKKIEVEQKDKEKDETALRLIGELDVFIEKFKLEKKQALEQRIQAELNGLMHKGTFISRVEVEVAGDIIDIHLFDRRDETILKESLSKGEQQLYATSILKALVDESNVQFPIFIDSPLQKFDKQHSKNVITEFYPNVSDQVVLFPLLEKELSEAEYEQLLPRVNSAFLIENIDQDSSKFNQIEPKRLFETYKKNNHVYTH